METSPLGRAEWMKFYGRLFGQPQRADSLFAVVDSSYHALKTLAQKAGTGRSVVFDKMVGSVWYMPGGHSTIGQMVQDAGASYPWADDEQSGSLSLSFETVLEKGGECDVWLFRYSADHDITRTELLSEHRGYDRLNAFQKGSVYGCNVDVTPFYEETPFRPDYLLNDLIQLVHPELSGLQPVRYYHQLKQ
jgi:iron complex transport system substrate-binding protein